MQLSRRAKTNNVLYCYKIKQNILIEKNTLHSKYLSNFN